MPIYEYKCPKCGVFEAMQRITEPSLKKCPTCKSKIERQISRGSFILKGSGWYATDYAKKSAPSTDSSESTGASATNGGDKSSGDSSSKASGDSKPASEAKPSSESKTSKTSSDAKGAAASKSSSDKSTSAKAAD